MMVGMADEVKCSGRGLVHPLFWTGLAVLLVNDRFLKHAHLVPGAITGKLSDFAGMLVTPVVLTALLRVRRLGTRMAVFACVALFFAAINLSRSFADALEAFTVHSPLPWRIWSDPTDLVALSMLPLAWWLSLRARGTTVGPRLAPYLRAGGLVLGVFACAGTSSSDDLLADLCDVVHGLAQARGRTCEMQDELPTHGKTCSGAKRSHPTRDGNRDSTDLTGLGPAPPPTIGTAAKGCAVTFCVRRSAEVSLLRSVVVRLATNRSSPRAATRQAGRARWGRAQRAGARAR